MFTFFWNFLDVFHQKICVFIIFIFFFFFFDEGSNISQSETGTGDQKLSVELYVLIERL